MYRVSGLGATPGSRLQQDINLHPLCLLSAVQKFPSGSFPLLEKSTRKTRHHSNWQGPSWFSINACLRPLHGGAFPVICQMGRSWGSVSSCSSLHFTSREREAAASRQGCSSKAASYVHRKRKLGGHFSSSRDKHR